MMILSVARSNISAATTMSRPLAAPPTPTQGNPGSVGPPGTPQLMSPGPGGGAQQGGPFTPGGLSRADSTGGPPVGMPGTPHSLPSPGNQPLSPPSSQGQPSQQQQSSMSRLQMPSEF